jgi:formate hydrogenlyase subunit 6/NADH:ubiquinone oxidoreductase subunit I
MAIEGPAVQHAGCLGDDQAVRGNLATQITEDNPELKMEKPQAGRKFRQKHPKVKTGCITCRSVPAQRICPAPFLSLISKQQDSPRKM